MAFQFPEDKNDFKAPNGITYTYSDGKWVVKSYGVPVEVPEAQPPITYQIQTDKVLRSGEPAIELVDSEGYFTNVKFETDGLISVGSNAQSIVISSEHIEEAMDSISDRVDDVDLGNQTQNDQINALETQIQLLAKAQAVGKWNYKRNITSGSVRPPSTATFYGTHKDGADVVLMNWADLRLIMISKTDIAGTEYAFNNFEEGDKVEILASDGSSAVYGTVTNNPNQEAYGNMIVTVERSNGGPPQNTEKEFLISVYRPGASGGDVDLDVVDERYISKFGDEMIGNLKVPDPLESEPLHAANKKYVDEAVGLNSTALNDYLKLSGGTLTGTLQGQLIKSIRTQGYAFEAKPDNGNTSASIHTDGRATFKGSVKVDGTVLAKGAVEFYESGGKLYWRK